MIATDPWANLAIVRQCRRCGEWRPLVAFAEQGRLCKDCIHQGSGHYRAVDRIAHSRGYALTDKARAALRELTPA